MKPVRIAFFDTKPYDRESFEAANREFGFEIRHFSEHLNPETAVLAAGYPAACAFVNDVISAPVVDTLVSGGTKLLAMRCAGYNNVDLAHAYQRLHVVRVPSYSPHAVAEHAAALMLTLNRKIHRAYFRTRDSNFSLQGLLGFDMAGKTAGVIGTGQIGRVLVKILRGFDMRVLVSDVHPDEAWASGAGARYADLETLYRESDILSLHCPLTAQTRHMINAETLAMMRPGVMIINTGRGLLIDTPALIEGLKTNRVGAAGLDVYEEESDYFFEDFSNSVLGDDVLARLLTFNNVLVTSHQAFFTREALGNIANTTLANVRDFFGERPMANSICYHCEKASCTRKATGRCF